MKSVKARPAGWPQLSALVNAEDRYVMFRRFGECHFRVLLHLQDEIARLEDSLLKLDLKDSENMHLNYRLRCGEHEEGWDRTQRDILIELQEKLLEYGKLSDITFSTISRC